MKVRGNNKESSNNMERGKGKPSISSIENHNEKPCHCKYSGELKNVSQYKKKINSSFMVNNYEDEIRYRKRWQVIELLIALLFIALIIKQTPSGPPFFIGISIKFLISGFAFFFLKLFQRGFTDIQNIRRELENLRLKTIFLQNAIDEEDKVERSKMLLEYIKADNKMFSSSGQPTTESFCKDVEGGWGNLLQSIKKVLDNIPSLRPNPH